MVECKRNQFDKHERILAERAEVLRCTRCPACDFDLRGNPTTDKCPECGFGNDPEAVWFRPSGALYVLAPYAMALMFGAFVWLWYNPGVRGAPLWTALHFVGIGIPLCCPVLFFWRRWRYHFRYEFLLIGKTRIQWRVSGRRECAIDWAEIERVSGSRFLEQVCLHIRGARHAGRVPRCLRPKSMQLDEFVGIVRRYWEHAHSHGDV